MTKNTISQFNEYYEKTRYNLVWNLCIVFCILLIIVSFVNYSNAKYSALPNFIAITYGLICLIILNITKEYRFVSKLISLLSLVLISATFFLLENVIHYTTPLWMILNILFTYFTLKSVWGTTVLVSHFSAFIVYIFTKHDYNVHSIPPFDQQDLFNYAIEFVILGFGIGYLLYQFVKTNNYAEKELTLANKDLTDKNLLISKQNTEMDVMLKEIHHRVKNNLQVIISLLKLQSIRQNNGGEIGYSEAINRIKAMSLIHEQMYQGELLSDFNLKNYLESFIEKLIESYAINIHVEIEIESDFTNLRQKNIVPLALLFNELITNSLKHAFTNQTRPKINVIIHKLSGLNFSLMYSDNGKWIDSSENSFGIELIDTMTEQLDGKKTLTISNEGTTYLFELKNVK